MNQNFKLLAILLICLVGHSAMAQKNKLFLESNKIYSTGKIYLKKSFVPIVAKDFKLMNDSILNYTDSGTGITKSMNLSTTPVNYIKIRTGTKAGEFALWGGAFMGLSALYGALSAENESLDTSGETSGVNWLPFVAGFTAGGAVIGGLIGVFVPKYKNFYLKDKHTAYTFGLSPYYYTDGSVGMKLQVRF
jgi:hypothetical protein